MRSKILTVGSLKEKLKHYPDEMLIFRIIGESAHIPNFYPVHDALIISPVDLLEDEDKPADYKLNEVLVI